MNLAKENHWNTTWSVEKINLLKSATKLCNVIMMGYQQQGKKTTDNTRQVETIKMKQEITIIKT